MIWTVFPKDKNEMPQDFATKQEAEKYAEECLECDYEIEWTTGEIV